MHLLHGTKTTIDPITLAIVSFGFFGSSGCGGSAISSFESKIQSNSFSHENVSRYGSFTFHP
jgi:hypothetical protein